MADCNHLYSWTGGVYDQRINIIPDLPKPAQWHRIVVHNEILGAYAVQQLAKNSPVFVEGDMETRVYNDSINGQIKNIPEICVRHDGKIRLIKTGESVGNITLNDLRRHSVPCVGMDYYRCRSQNHIVEMVQNGSRRLHLAAISRSPARSCYMILDANRNSWSGRLVSSAGKLVTNCLGL